MAAGWWIIPARARPHKSPSGLAPASPRRLGAYSARTEHVPWAYRKQPKTAVYLRIRAQKLLVPCAPAE